MYERTRLAISMVTFLFALIGPTAASTMASADFGLVLPPDTGRQLEHILSRLGPSLGTGLSFGDAVIGPRRMEIRVVREGEATPAKLVFTPPSGSGEPKPGSCFRHSVEGAGPGERNLLLRLAARIDSAFERCPWSPPLPAGIAKDSEEGGRFLPGPGGMESNSAKKTRRKWITLALGILLSMVLVASIFVILLRPSGATKGH